MGKIIAICRSQQTGTRKEPASEGFLKEDYGLLGDAHANLHMHRQVSLLAIESINKMRDRGFNVGPGDFAENLTTEGIDLTSLPVGTCLFVGHEVILEVTQLGKECHTGCAIFHKIGKCIMPKEGLFARVVHGGAVKAGDAVEINKG